MVDRRFVLFGLPALLSACGGGPLELDPDGNPLRRVYRLEPGGMGDVQFRVLDGVNALRAARGAGAVALNAELNAAAATHSRDMAVQNRPWHFGSDGSSPVDRLVRVGYSGTLIGETISETFETELETLAAWMQAPNTRGIILDPRARDLGFFGFQEANGKIWWTLVLATPAPSLELA
ncbi:MAG: CAP domain-containing protein [Pseudomonadota bacterium]